LDQSNIGIELCCVALPLAVTVAYTSIIASSHTHHSMSTPFLIYYYATWHFRLVGAIGAPRNLSVLVD
jgi:hypothetical protein